MQLAESLRVRDRIFSTGFMDDRGVSEAFAACACVALPYRDGASFRRGTLMAALVHGCAIVTTAPRAAVPELRHGDNVWLVPPDDPPALAAAIERVIAEDSLRIRLQAGSRELAGLFTWDRIAAETLRVFERLL
jgi:glycosyltransferase involved in cell wall biosynthesis